MSLEDDGPPPLEDMTETLSLLKIKKQAFAPSVPARTVLEGDENKAKQSAIESMLQIKKASSVPESQPATPALSKAQPDVQPNPPKAQAKPKQKGGMFSGLQGGFFGKPSKKPAAASSAPHAASGSKQPAPAPSSTSKKVDYHIKASSSSETTSGPGLRLPEVQEAVNSMKASLSDTKTWLNEDMLQKVASNPRLAAGLQNPRLLKAMGEIQANPKLAKEKYGQDREIAEFYKSFMELMGNHLSGLAEAEEKQSKKAQQKAEPDVQIQQRSMSHSGPSLGGRSVDPAAVQRWMSDPQIVAALNDENTSKMLSVIQSDSSAFLRLISHPNIRTLVKAGILAIPPQYAHMNFNL